MVLRYNETLQDRINAIKTINKKHYIIKIILKTWLFLIACVLFFRYQEKFYSFSFLVAIVLITTLDVIKTKKRNKVIRDKFNYLYNGEAFYTTTFDDDKLTILNDKNDNTYTLTYEKIKKIKITKEYIFILSTFKEYVFIKKSNITLDEYNSIIKLLKEKNIIKK